MSVFPGFVGGSYRSRSRILSADQTIGLYPETDEVGTGKNVSALYGTPGLTLFVTLPQGPVRGLWSGIAQHPFWSSSTGEPNGPHMFAVGGTHLYAVYSDGTIKDHGFIGANNGSVVQMFSNGGQLMIVSNGQVYVDQGAGAIPVNFDDASGPVLGAQGAYLDGFFIVSPPETRTFYLSQALNGFNWDPLDFAQKEAYPDNINAILADHEELWLFGSEESTEVWRNVGNPDFPFQRDPSGILHFGCAAPHSPTRLSNGVAWIAFDTARGNAIAMYAQGFLPIRVSTHAVEEAWRSYSTIADAVSFVYIEDGHEFWVLTFPSGNATWVYDMSTGLWHERGYWNGASNDRQRQWCHTFVGLDAFGSQPTPLPVTHNVGDFQNGNIYLQSIDYFTDNGNPIQRSRTCPHISNEQMWTFFHRLQLDMEVGVGNTPVLTLEWSDDGGQTFPHSMTATAGALGQYKARVIWRRLGKSRDRVFRVSTLDPSKQAWINAYLRLTAGTS